MLKSERGKQGFVIKLSSETVQKLNEEEQKGKNEEELAKLTSTSQIDTSKQQEKTEQQHSVEVINSKENEDSQENIEVQKALLNKSSRDTSTSTCNENWGEYAPYVTYEGEDAFYTDPSSQQKYKWNKTTNAWDPQAGSEVSGRQYTYEDDTHVYIEPDGSKFFWDDEKKAWIPKVDDDFLAFYQMSYGFVDNAKKEADGVEKKKLEKKQDSGLKRKNEPQWFEPSDEKNTKVYVSNLPLDTTEEEFVDLMQKCGLVERDPSSQKMKIKMYMDKEQNCFKGDALCTYIKIESVDLALNLLDGSDFKGNTIKVEKAHFELKGAYNPSLKPKKKKKKELEKIKKMQQKLFDWRPEKFIGERSKHERVVIVKNLFHPTDFDKEVQLILDYQQDLREECGKCGDVRKVVIYDRHPEGVAQITMKEPEQADAVIQLINGRWFGKRQITAEIWDGRTKYRIAETDADISKRIDKWDKFLEQEEKEGKSTVSTANVNNEVKDSVAENKLLTNVVEHTSK
ncbi:unnamed protein product [Leptosia nina]|uniref:17S U2 SnRNP complex component HTATSF1 n=1 Tax=Leptosia nina TaxID=320188 RepID=A0AAV1JXE8_9NEOP